MIVAVHEDVNVKGCEHGKKKGMNKFVQIPDAEALDTVETGDDVYALMPLSLVHEIEGFVPDLAVAHSASDLVGIGGTHIVLTESDKLNEVL